MRPWICDDVTCPFLHSGVVQAEPAPGRGAFEFLGGAQITLRVRVCVSGGTRAIYDRVQLLTLAKACNRFLMCAVLSVSLSLSKSITFS